MLCFLFKTPRHLNTETGDEAAQELTRVSRKHSHWWAEISMRRTRCENNREELNNWEVFVWRIGSWDCLSNSHVLSRCFVQCSGVLVLHCGGTVPCLSQNCVTAKCFWHFFFPVALQPNLGPGRLTVEVYRSLKGTNTHRQRVGLLWTSNQPVAQAATWKTHHQRNRRT